MKKEKELVIRMAEAEQELVAVVNSIMKKHALPCFLTELIFDRIHRQIIDGKTSELAAALEAQKRTPIVPSGDKEVST